ncbi:MAG: Sua5/YciO/YrdC/YwlC family protein [Bacteroidales bacterium]|nr:Sua5/YciO/YrdC/YwlC family protein [Candidatus Colimorpha onthohippi]
MIQALHTIREGGVILYPTDTIWGLGCDASNADAIAKIQRIKQRDPHKNMLVLALPEFTTILNPTALNLLQNSIRPTTVIVPIHQIQFHNSTLGNYHESTLGIRFPKHPFCQSLLHSLGCPIISTSANLSGEPSPAHFEEISDKIKLSVDYCVPNLPEYQSNVTQASRILKIEPSGEINVIRD